jgi:hypothetical protein
MNQEIISTKISHLADCVRGVLRDPKGRYFDPAVVEEWFARFAMIRGELKRDYPQLFSDLLDRGMPKRSGTTDNDGRGYIPRNELERLRSDCGYCWGLLRMATPSLGTSTDQSEESVGNRIFVSHASNDKPLVEFFVEQILRLGLEVPSDDIFCTSLEGMDIKNGEDFRRAIQSAISNAKIILLILTPNYKASEVCLNEMGAAWASSRCVVPLAVEPVTYKSVGVLMEPLQIPGLSDGFALSKLKDQIVFELGLTTMKTAMWDAKKTVFLRGLDAKIAECKFPAFPACK